MGEENFWKERMKVKIKKKQQKKNRLLVRRERCLEERLCLSDLNISLITHVWDTHTPCRVAVMRTGGVD